MLLKNYMENLVWQTMDEVLDAHPGSCKCEKCRLDIAALALNELPPRYVVTEKGETYTKVKSLEMQFNVDVWAALAKSIQIVAEHPRHSL